MDDVLRYFELGRSTIEQSMALFYTKVVRYCRAYQGDTNALLELMGG